MFALCDKLRNAQAAGTLYSDKVMRMDRRICPFLRTLRGWALVVGLLAGCASEHAAKPASAPLHRDAAAHAVIAEAELKRGDCRGASET